MKKLFRKIKKVEKKIEQKNEYVSEVSKSEYYAVFGTRTEQIVDLNLAYKDMFDLNNKRIKLLTILKTKIENEINNNRAV